MKKLLFFLLLLLLISCTKSTLTHEQIITNYYDGLNTANFQNITKLLSDSLITVEGKYSLTSNKKEYYKLFRWDSVFCPSYKILDLKKTDNSIEINVSKICKRIAFLQDSALITKVNFEFENDQISKINTTDYLSLNYTTWETSLNYS